MRVIEVPEHWPGSIRRFGDHGVPARSTIGLGRAGAFEVCRGGRTLAVLRDREVRTLLRLDRECQAALAREAAVVYIALEADGGATELIRWDVERALLEPLATIPGRFTDVCARPDGTAVALFGPRGLVVHDGTRGDPIWSRTRLELAEHDVPTEIFDHFSFEGDAIAFRRQRYDRDEPDYTFVLARVPASGPIELQSKTQDGSTPPAWYAIPVGEVVTKPYCYDCSMLAVARDGSRIATERSAYSTVDGVFVPVRALEEWYSLSSFNGGSGTYSAVAIAYDATGQLWRISTETGRAPLLERCHGDYTPAIELSKEATKWALLPGDDVRVVFAIGGEIRLGRLEQKTLVDERVLIAGVASRALVCAVDGSAIAVDAGATTHVLEPGGRTIAALAPPAAVLAVAPSGAAVACVHEERLTIVRAGGVVRGPPDALPRAAFSCDGRLVAYATAAEGFAIADAKTGQIRATRTDLVSSIAAFVFTERSLFTLGEGDSLVEWDLARLAP